MKISQITLLFMIVLMVQSRSHAVDFTLSEGDAAPTFTVLDDSGKEWKSDDHFGKKIVVIFFYPADMTGGCTRQACGFRDDLAKLHDQGVEVVGVSGDSVQNHQLFKKVHSLNFPLLADTKGVVAGKFGVPFDPTEKTITVEVDGQTETLTRGGTAKRWTFVIDQQGKVAHKNENVNAAEDSKTIAAVVEKLKTSN